MKLIGMLLIVFGAAALAVGEITYTRREQVLAIGPVRATTERRERIPLPPAVGFASISVGIVLVVAGFRRHV